MSMRLPRWTLVVLAAATLGVQAAEPEEPDNIFGIRMPRSLDDLGAVAHADAEAGFTFMQAYSAYFYQGMRRYDDPRLGYSLGYATPTGDISIYVYDYGLDDIPEGTESKIVADDLVNSTHGIAQSGQYARVEEHADSEPLSPHFVQTFQTLTTHDGRQLSSYVLLRAQNGYLVKVRATGTKGMEPRVADFLMYVARDIGIENAGAHAAFNGQKVPQD